MSDRAWLEAMLDAERALAAAEAAAGVIPAEAAAAVADALRAELYDIEALAREGRAAGNPVEPLVRAIRERVGGEPPASSTSGRRARTSSTRRRCSSRAGAASLIDAELGGARRSVRAARRASTARR